MNKKTFVVATGLCLGVVSAVGQGQGPAAPEPLYAAIRSGDVAKVSALLASSADVNAKERRGGATPLMLAAAFGSLDTMRMLIDKGADVNARSAGDATALMWAVNDIDKVRLLIDKGADVNAVSSLGRSALFLAAMSERSAEIVRLLVARGADVRLVAKDNTAMLAAAAIGNDTETIRFLIDRGADINGRDFLGRTALMNVATNGNVAAVKLLLAKGADVKAVSFTPEANPQGRVKNGIIALGSFTVLHAAAPNGPPEIVKALLAAGADANAPDSRGLTPLMLAVATDHGDVEIVKALLAKGADVAAKDKNGDTAADWAAKSGTNAALAELKKANAPLSPFTPYPVPAAAPVSHRAAVERSVALLERSTGTFFTNGACAACHAQNVTDLATMTARQRGVPIDSEAAAQRATGAAARFAALASGLLERLDGPTVDIPLFTLGALAASGYPADRATDALMFNVVAQQRAGGNWHRGGIARPPIEDGDFSGTALGVLALKRYGIPGRGAEMNARAERAVKWLQAAKPLSTEDYAFRLLGLAWGGADAASLDRTAKELLGIQRADGGWGQRPEMGSDAYGTGVALFALRESRARASSDANVQRGMKYLLSSQRADGSWYVRSRSPKFQPYFDGGFPYEHDQWISAMATGWATAALATGLDDPKATTGAN